MFFPLLSTFLPTHENIICKLQRFLILSVKTPGCEKKHPGVLHFRDPKCIVEERRSKRVMIFKKPLIMRGYSVIVAVKDRLMCFDHLGAHQGKYKMVAFGLFVEVLEAF